MNYLNDIDFLYLLDNEKIKTQYARIVIMSFDEKPIREIQGTISSGNLNVNGSSAVRRTVNLTMNATEDTNKLTNLNNIISINKKFKLEVGYKNNFSDYKHYGNIIWFPCGTYIIDKANLARNTTGYTISLSGKDKMAQLDGTVGGTLPASVTFHERYEIDDEGNITVSYPTMYQIIQEAVNHYGDEPINNIYINDLEETAKLLVKYSGDTPIWFSVVNGNTSPNFTISSTSPGDGYAKYINGQDVGYFETEATYPGELVLDAGGTVTQLLDKINTVLGKTYEYFYDVEGRFIFQQIQDYKNNYYTPNVVPTNTDKKENSLTNLSGKSYIRQFYDSRYLYVFNNSNTTVSANYNPNYDNIKNDFIVWGSRETAAGAKIGIRYHLAIDEKPKLNLCNYHMWAIKDKETNRIIRYEYTNNNIAPSASAELIGKPCDEWREELYRKALESALDATAAASHYDEELLAEWRNLYNPTTENYSIYGYWNPDVYENPGVLNYWLDFIDSNSVLGEYSVNKIGRRTKVVKNDSIKTIYNTDVPDIIFFQNPNNSEELRKKIEYFNSQGQQYCILNEQQILVFNTSSTGASAYDNIRELLYQHLVYNISVNISCLPRYYFEPNMLIHVYDRETGVEGDFVIKQFSLPLTYSGTMSITANEALTRI